MSRSVSSVLSVRKRGSLGIYAERGEAQIQNTQYTAQMKEFSMDVPDAALLFGISALFRVLT
jgi:hypothetical protein